MGVFTHLSDLIDHFNIFFIGLENFPGSCTIRIMWAYLSEKRTRIIGFFASYFPSLKQDTGRINQWGRDTLERLEEYLSRGKMVRGALVSFGHDMYGGAFQHQALQAGAAMELFQSAFLIHDDIMDQDLFRRGKPSIHSQYRDLLKSRFGMPLDRRMEHLADSLGICAGDVALFLAFELLGSLEVPLSILQSLLKLFTRELMYVGFAQMEDVYYGGGIDSPEEKEILALYRYKTGRYTFSLPLMAGGILAAVPSSILSTLSRLGEQMGVLFQLKDDELGLFGEAEEVGKPIGSDVVSNKKTLYRYYLFQAVDGKDRKKLQELFGAPQIQEEDLVFLRSLLEETGARGRVDRLMDQLEEESRRIIQELDVPSEWRDKLFQLVEYNRKRDK
ncbi:MAG: hypothetical protein Kow009_00740 [Spirochaetales bacterium]